MEAVEGIDDLHMSGARAVFTLEPGAKVEQDSIAKAFEEMGMKLESLGQEERQRAKWRYDVDAGIT